MSRVTQATQVFIWCKAQNDLPGAASERGERVMSTTALLFADERGAKYCDEYVCVSAHISLKPHGRTSPNFL